MELVKGANTRLHGQALQVALHASLAAGEIELCALLLGPDRRVRSDADFVFFNQPRSGCGSTRRLSPTSLRIELTDVPGDVIAVLLTANVDDAIDGSLADRGGGAITIADASTTVRHQLDGLTTERCVIAAEVYRRDGGWKVRAVSQGYDDLAQLATVHGIQVDDTAPASPASAPPPRTPLPAETHEIIDRIRAGAAARRAASVPHRRRLPATPTTRRGNMTVTQYKNARRAEAEQLTAECHQQIHRLETMLTQLPHPDLALPLLDGLLDASLPQPTGWRRVLFGRRDPNPTAPSPAQALGPALRQIHRLAGDPNHRAAVEAWLWIGVRAADLQPSFGHLERLTAQPDHRRVIIDVASPDRSLVPSSLKIRYQAVTDHFEHIPLPNREQERLRRTLISAGVLAHAHVIATGLGFAGLPPDWTIATNSWEWDRDPATGRQRQVCRATLVTSPRELSDLNLPEVEPSACVRALGGSASVVDPVTPRVTATRSSGRGRRIDLRTIDPYEFERLIAELAEAMGYTAYLTPRSRDHGVDVFVESTDTLANGKIVISAKRFNHTVGPDHVRALESVVRDQGAIKGILITTSQFGPESFRIARDKPLELVDGEQLQAWLSEYLDLD